MKSEQYKIRPKMEIVILLFISSLFGLPESGALSLIRNENKEHALKNKELLSWFVFTTKELCKRFAVF